MNVLIYFGVAFLPLAIFAVLGLLTLLFHGFASFLAYIEDEEVKRTFVSKFMEWFASIYIGFLDIFTGGKENFKYSLGYDKDTYELVSCLTALGVSFLWPISIVILFFVLLAKLLRTIRRLMKMAHKHKGKKEISFDENYS